MTRNFSKLIYTKPQVQEAQRIPKRINAKNKEQRNKKPASKRIISKLHKTKDKES